jgi:hypothetical protein
VIVFSPPQLKPLLVLVMLRRRLLLLILCEVFDLPMQKLVDGLPVPKKRQPARTRARKSRQRSDATGSRYSRQRVWASRGDQPA